MRPAKLDELMYLVGGPESQQGDVGINRTGRSLAGLLPICFVGLCEVPPIRRESGLLFLC